MKHTLQVDCPGIPLHIWNTSVGCLFTCWVNNQCLPEIDEGKKAGNNTVVEFSPVYHKLYIRLSYTDKPVQTSISDFSAILVPISRLKNIPWQLKFIKYPPSQFMQRHSQQVLDMLAELTLSKSGRILLQKSLESL